MTDFEDFQIIIDNLVMYFTGTHEILGILICTIFFFILISRGIEAKYSVIFTLPLLAAFIMAGWFVALGNPQWIINLGLMLISIIYGTAIVKLMT